MKLGLKPPNKALLAKLPKLKDLGVELPEAAPAVHWGRAVALPAWGMDLNDSIGDCVFASADHAGKCWLANTDRQFGEATPDEMIQAYHAVAGYDPDDPSTDQGAHWTDALAYWRQTGFTFGGRLDKISAYVSLDLEDENEIKLGVQWFGAAMAGIALPLSAQNQQVWDAVEGPAGEVGSWGGHAVPIIGYDKYLVYVITWGKPKGMTWRFAKKYMWECYAVLSPDWIEKSGASPAGIQLGQLQSYLDRFAQMA